MKKENGQLVQDVGLLVEETMVAEAASEVFAMFGEALAKLDPTLRSLLEAHFDGQTMEKISADMKLSKSEVETCIKRAKQELVHEIRRQTCLRH